MAEELVELGKRRRSKKCRTVKRGRRVVRICKTKGKKRRR